jgi:Carboxypeptidase regulatory-like domain/TonB dependent receptor
MKRLCRFWALAIAALLAAGPAFAQGTTGAIEGKVTDEQGLALPGANVTATRPSTGFTRTTTTDVSGVFRLPGLLVGAYTVKVELSGFAASTHSVIVNVSATTTPDVRMRVAGQTEQVTVMAETPIIDSTDSGVGEIITSAQIENLPLNGRQFGNLAALAPGVSLGFHTDPTKSTQFAPQVGGGGGRNINYLIDGGDNNDDTVGGMVQNFPLDSIGEFNFETSRFRADTGRANGGTIKVVTKGGTNELRGSGFGYFRNEGLNSQTQTEKNAGTPKGEYERWQYGASLGGPIVRDKTHFFASVERISQDTQQTVNTLGLYPEKDGVYDIPYRELMAVGKLTHQFNASHYMSVRYGYNDNSQPYGAGSRSAPESWGDNQNKFHSANLNLSSVLGGGKLNEFTFQYSYFYNHIAENETLPSESYPNGVFVGTSVNVPQTTEQHKYQFRDDFTWTKGRHQFRAGASFIYEPTLDITFSTGQQPLYSHLADSRTSPISSISYNGSIGSTGSGLSGATIPNNQYSLYLQDGWQVTDRLMLDIGVRYDLVTGFAFDQDDNILYSELQAAARAGVFTSSGLPCPCPGFEDFGQEPAEDKNNIAPRVGFAYDVKGNGDMIIRGGAGRYFDFAYTNANILFAVIGAQSSFGQVYSHTNSAGIRNADGSLYQVGQPLPPNQLTNVSTPLPSHAATPRPTQPYTDQANLGFAKNIGNGFAVEIEGVYAKGQELGTRPLLNVRINNGPRRFVGILPRMGNSNFRIDVMEGESVYKGINLVVKKRWDGRLQMLASYTLSDSKSSASLRATDEFGDYNVLDAFDPWADRQLNPTFTDARHRFQLSGTWSPGWDVNISPIFRYRSETPYNIITGFDDNLDGATNDIPATAETQNSGRGSDFLQLDLRVSKRFSLGSRARAELIAEMFNVTNDTNPGSYVGNMRSATFGQATTFSGDFRRGEQRIAQLGLRLEF